MVYEVGAGRMDKTVTEGKETETRLETHRIPMRGLGLTRHPRRLSVTGEGHRGGHILGVSLLFSTEVFDSLQCSVA